MAEKHNCQDEHPLQICQHVDHSCCHARADHVQNAPVRIAVEELQEILADEKQLPSKVDELLPDAGKHEMGDERHRKDLVHGVLPSPSLDTEALQRQIKTDEDDSSGHYEAHGADVRIVITRVDAFVGVEENPVQVVTQAGECHTCEVCFQVVPWHEGGKDLTVLCRGVAPVIIIDLLSSAYVRLMGSRLDVSLAEKWEERRHLW